MKLAKVVLSIVLMIPFVSATASAQIENEELHYNQYLEENGYPQELISEYELEQKKDLYENGGVYVTSSTTEDNLSDQESGEFTIQALEDKNFTHTISISRIRTSQKGIAQFKVNYNWSWKYAPVFYSTDKFGLAWNNDYAVVNNSAMHSYKYFFKDNITGETKTSGGVQQKGYKTISPGTGIGWDVNLVSNGRPVEHKGWSSVTLQKGHDYSGNAETSSMVASYFHRRVAVYNPVLSFAKEPSLAVTFGWAHDEAIPASYTWTWTKSDYLN